VTEDVTWQSSSVERGERESATGGTGGTVWLTGLSGSGKSTIAYAVEAALVGSGIASYVLDGDNLRHGLNADLGFSASDRAENVRRVGEVALLMADAGILVLVPVIAPYAADRAMVRDAHGKAGVSFFEVFVDAPLEVCEERDPKGLYAKARRGDIVGMTGIDSPYEVPSSPDLTIDGAGGTIESGARAILALLSA